MSELVEDDKSAHPLSRLIDAENAAPRMAAETERERFCERPDHSRGGAWLALSQRFGHRFRRISQFLRISLSHTHRCFAKTQRLAKRQMAIGFVPFDARAELRPWRKERFDRAPRQFELDFCDGSLFGGPSPLHAFAQAADAGSMPSAPRLRAK